MYTAGTPEHHSEMWEIPAQPVNWWGPSAPRVKGHTLHFVGLHSGQGKCSETVRSGICSTRLADSRFFLKFGLCVPLLRLIQPIYSSLSHLMKFSIDLNKEGQAAGLGLAGSGLILLLHIDILWAFAWVDSVSLWLGSDLKKAIDVITISHIWFTSRTAWIILAGETSMPYLCIFSTDVWTFWVASESERCCSLAAVSSR